MATQREVASHLDMTQQAVSDLARRGIISSDGRGAINLDEARVSYIRHIRAQAAGRLGDSDSELDITAERARKAKEEADRLEMQNAQLRRELLSRDDVDAAVVGAFARVRARLLGIPSKVAPIAASIDNPAEVEAEVRKAVYDALSELSETNVSDLCGDNGDMVEDTITAA